MSQPCTFLDVMPTCLELAETTYPSTYNDNSIKPLCDEARSFVPLLQDKESWDEERTLYWEHERGKAVRKGNWRLTALADGGWQTSHTTFRKPIMWQPSIPRRCAR